jgi:exosortase F-associated protein
MLQLLLKNKEKLFWSLLLILLLVCIRLFENQLFYDPFLKYFKSEYAHLPFPRINIFKLFFSLGIRFYLNSVISLLLLYVLFKDKQIVKFSMLLYMILGSVLMISFIFTLNFFGEESKMTLFYIRRFLIQPIFIMLFIPAFYYQKHSSHRRTERS